MYRSHYNLSEKPFQLTTDPKFLWLGEKHKEALATLKYGVIEQKGFLLVTGDVGTGKTTLINALLDTLDENTLVANIKDPALNLIDFFNLIAISFNISQKFESKVDFIVYFSQFLKEVYSENKGVLLIIDEVHSLSKELLEHIRLLSNIELPSEKLLNIFLVGQNEIHQTLSLQQFRAIRQRISLAYQIQPLSERETSEYIKHRLKVAGTEKEIFNQGAVWEIYRFSNGYPRLINIICDHGLLTGFTRDLKKITSAIIKECSQELRFQGETKKNTPSNFPYQQSYYEHSPNLVNHPFENEMSMEKGIPKNQDPQAISLQQVEGIEKSMNLRRFNKENVNKDLIESTIVRMRKNILFWSSFITFAVIVMVLTWPSNKNRSLKENSRQPVASVLTAHTTSPIKTDHNSSSLTSKDINALTMPALSKRVAQNDISKPKDTVRFLVMSKDKDDIVKAENTKLNPDQDRVLPRKYIVYLHYSNENNKKIMEELAIFLKNKGFKVNGITRVDYKNRDIRYFYSRDKSGALILKKYLTQFITPYTHLKDMNIKVLNLSHKYPNAKKGALELWVNF
jgi:type II secretory pathway predicted ATPase ExeA